MTQPTLFPEATPSAPAPTPLIGYLIAGKVRHVSAPRTIGRHDWLYVIYECRDWGTRDTYLWRRRHPGFPESTWGEWSRTDKWPRFDRNRSDDGLPRSLVRLWEDERPARLALGLRQ